MATIELQSFEILDVNPICERECFVAGVGIMLVVRYDLGFFTLSLSNRLSDDYKATRELVLDNDSIDGLRNALMYIDHLSFYDAEERIENFVNDVVNEHQLQQKYIDYLDSTYITHSPTPYLYGDASSVETIMTRR